MADFAGFRNRLQKNLKHWGKWARRRGIDCYRIYDREMPDFPLAIDLYEGHPHVQEYSTSWNAGTSEYDQWLQGTLAVLAEALARPIDSIAFKRRQRQRGESQYTRTGAHGRDMVVHEGGLKFWVNLEAYLDTGLFLDHRNARALIREQAAGTRFLNLFAYTGSFTVYAAAGGARESVSVDLSNTYQAWTRRNLELNGIDLSAHQRIRRDVFEFLDGALQERERFDLIVLDPPSFSNSKKMREILDVQRDHPRLINGCLDLLTPDGTLFFSTNRQGFTLASERLHTTQFEEMTRQTLPEDFARSQMHRSWWIRK